MYDTATGGSSRAATAGATGAGGAASAASSGVGANAGIGGITKDRPQKKSAIKK